MANKTNCFALLQSKYLSHDDKFFSDVPEAPSGPIEFTDISAKGVTLSWSPTKDDGGSPITHYIIEKKEEGRKVWTSGNLEFLSAEMLHVFLWLKLCTF